MLFFAYQELFWTCIKLSKSTHILYIRIISSLLFCPLASPFNWFSHPQFSIFVHVAVSADLLSYLCAYFPENLLWILQTMLFSFSAFPQPFHDESFACCWLQRVTLTVSNIGFAVFLTTILVRTLNYHRSFETYGFNIRTIPMFFHFTLGTTDRERGINFLYLFS